MCLLFGNSTITWEIGQCTLRKRRTFAFCLCNFWVSLWTLESQVRDWAFFIFLSLSWISLKVLSQHVTAFELQVQGFPFNFSVCYLRMQMQTLCRAVKILITTSCSTSVKFFYRGLTEVFIASPFCDKVHERQVKHNHLSWICREPRWMSSLNRELS